MNPLKKQENGNPLMMITHLGRKDGKSMNGVIQKLIKLFWICDILNMPFMEMFDITYPLNTEFWILVFIFVLGTENIIGNCVSNTINVIKKIRRE